jgi:hypothetical protein
VCESGFIYIYIRVFFLLMIDILKRVRTKGGRFCVKKVVFS